MLSPDDFWKEYPTDELEAAPPDSPTDSLRNLQYLYPNTR